MVVIDLFKCIDEEFICISKKIGLYIKNSDKDELYTYVNSHIPAVQIPQSYLSPVWSVMPLHAFSY